MWTFKKKSFFLIIIVVFLTTINFVLSANIGDVSKLNEEAPDVEKEGERLAENQRGEEDEKVDENRRVEDQKDELLYGYNYHPHDKDTEKVKFIAVVFRHGDRTPDSLYPKYPNQYETFYPYGLGELTNVSFCLTTQFFIFCI